MEERESKNRSVDVDQLETLFLQHLRTAGLRKQREKVLVEEFQQLRSARKAIFEYMARSLSEVSFL